MSGAIIALGIMISLIDSDAVLDKAAENGFFYRNVEISAVEKCSAPDTCVKIDSKTYSVRKKDSVRVAITAEKGKLTLDITPEEAFISYFLYIEHRSGVTRIQMKSRNIVIDQGVANIYRIQLSATAPQGPVVLWGKTLKEPPDRPFRESFAGSIDMLRKMYSLKPFTSDETLKDAAEMSLERVMKEGLVHYSAKTGGIRHTGVAKKVLGENLYRTESEEKAWSMMVKSPSHLYNLINPQFSKYFHLRKEKNGILNGVLVFSE